MEFLDHDEHHNMVSHPENSEAFAGLTVNSGVAEPPKVNPYFHPRKRRRTMTAGEYVEGILKGDVTVLSRAVTLVESLVPEHQALAQEVIEKCLPSAGNSRRIGITGVPGAGKSTSIDEFGLHVLKDGGKLAVLAIDPSSERTKGSILGDKTRMEKLSIHPKAFIRPSPSAGSLGGVARKTRESIVLCEAAGFNNIFVETVGVGQSDNIERANLAKAQFQSALHLFPPTLSGWIPEVLTYSGYYGIGIKEVWEMIDRYFEFVKGNGYFEHRRMEQEKYWMYETIDEQLKAHFYRDPEVEALLKVKQDNVLATRLALTFDK